MDRLTRHKWLENNWDLDPDTELDTQYLNALTYYQFHGTVPAMCLYGCEVELDGYCQHNNPSPLIDGGFI